MICEDSLQICGAMFIVLYFPQAAHKQAFYGAITLIESNVQWRQRKLQSETTLSVCNCSEQKNERKKAWRRKRDSFWTLFICSDAALICSAESADLNDHNRFLHNVDLKLCGAKRRARRKIGEIGTYFFDSLNRISWCFRSRSGQL